MIVFAIFPAQLRAAAVTASTCFVAVAIFATTVTIISAASANMPSAAAVTMLQAGSVLQNTSSRYCCCTSSMWCASGRCRESYKRSTDRGGGG